MSQQPLKPFSELTLAEKDPIELGKRVDVLAKMLQEAKSKDEADIVVKELQEIQDYAAVMEAYHNGKAQELETKGQVIKGATVATIAIAGLLSFFRA